MLSKKEVASALTHAGAEPDAVPDTGRLPLVPWRFVGMGLLIAWLCCTHLPQMFVNLAPDVGAETQVSDWMRVGDVLTFLLVAVLAPRIGRVSDHRALCAWSVAACCLGTLTLPALTAHLGISVLLAAVSALTAVGGAVLFLLWAEVYCRLGPARCLLFGAFACVLAGVVSLVVSRMDAVASTVCIAVLPALCLASARSSLAYLRGGEGQACCRACEPSGKVRYPLPWKIILLMAFAGFTSGFAGSLLVDIAHIGAVHRIFATAAFGLLILALFAVRGLGFDLRVLAWGTLPVALASFVAIPLLGQTAGVVISFLVKFSYIAFALFALAMIATVAWRYDVPSTRLFACARASSEGAMFAGILLQRWCQTSGALDNEATLWVIALVGVLAIVGCVVLWHSERAVGADWGTMGVDAASGTHTPSAHERVIARCEELAARFDLTAREKEILTLLAQGMEPAQVEQTLIFSHNTLKTHLRHIYAKLGVHTREEAMALAREAGTAAAIR